MIRKLAVFLVLAQVGCLTEDLGFSAGPPFACSDGACPDGYHCAQALCIAEGAADPPLWVASTALTDAPPIPLWNGTHFSAVWQDTADPTTAGVHLASVDRQQLTGDLLAVPASSSVAFSAVFETTSRRYVIAAARNDLLASELRVVSTSGTEAPISVLPKPESYPASPIGFSKPALSSRQDGTFTLAYTRGDPPALSSDNLFCSRISLVSPGAATESCGPRLKATQFASEVSFAEFPRTTIFQWKAEATYLSVELKDSKLPPRNQVIDEVVHTEKVLNANQSSGAFAVVGQFVVSGGLPTWQLRLGDSTTGSGAASAKLDSVDVVPDVDGDGHDGFVVCQGSSDGTASVYSYVKAAAADGSTTIVEAGPARPLPRYSKAPVESCRIVVAAETQTIGVLWRERVPPATGKIYFTTMPLFP